MTKKLLQLALDFLNLDDAISLAKKVAPFIDIVEAGTPLIKYNGLKVVSKLKETFPDKIICADMKMADIGDLEVKIAAEAGADMTTVLGAAPVETILAAVKESKNYKNVKIAVDTLGIKDTPAEGFRERIREIERAGPDFLLIHCGIDEQKTGKNPLENIKAASEITNLPLIACGGVNAELAKKIKEIDKVKIVIVGGAITKAKDPASAAKEIKNNLS